VTKTSDVVKNGVGGLASPPAVGVDVSGNTLGIVVNLPPGTATEILAGIEDLVIRKIEKSHPFCRESCRARYGGNIGVLGLSVGVWSTVWFVSENDDVKLFAGEQQEAVRRYNDFKQRFAREDGD